MNPERLLALYDRIADAPGAVGRLRRFILDLAVRGKLVPQDPQDEAASELLNCIAAEKAKHGLPVVTKQLPDKDAPFTLPAGWVWTRIGEITIKTGSGSTPRGGKEVYRSSGVPFLRSQNVYDDGLRLNDVAFIDAETHEKMSGTSVKPGDLLLNITGGSMGRCCCIPEKFGEANISQHVAIIRLAIKGMAGFTHRLVLSPYFQAFIFGEQTGAGRGGLPKNKMDKIPVALPPLSEQHRIVAKVDELMALCDRLEEVRMLREESRDRLAAASFARLNTPDPDPTAFARDARFALGNLSALTTRPDQVIQLRQTIMNLAVRGRLVPQDPNDQPASELVGRIAEERNQLIKQRVIRREEPLRPVVSADVPFDLPRGWVWSRVGDAVLFTQYGTSQKAGETGVPVLTMGNIQNGRVVLGREKCIPENSDDIPGLYLKKLDILYNRTNSAELVGKTGIFVGGDDIYTFASYLIRLRPSHQWTEPHFINLAMNAPQFRETQIIPLIKKQTGQANVNGTALKNMLIPLPPIAEQRRIIAKVDELMALCDGLEARLTTAADTRRNLLDALLADALEPTMGALEAAE